MSSLEGRTARHFALAFAGFCAVSIVMAALCIGVWKADSLSPVAAKAISITFFLLAIPFLVLLHELGHLLVAVALSWRVPILCVGAFSLRFSPLLFKYGRPAFTGAAGAIVAVPPDRATSRMESAAISAGGPAANLIVAAVAVWAALQAPRSSTAAALFMAVAAISLFSGLYNLIPFRARSGQGSDSLHILAALLGPDPAIGARNVRLAAETIDGKRPQDWSPSLVRAVEADSMWTGNPAALMLVYAWHLDRGEIDRARIVLARAVAKNASQAFVEEAFMLSWFDKKAIEARTAISNSRATSNLRHTPAYWRAEAAIAVAANDHAGFREALRKWRMACDDWAFTTQDERDWIDRIQSKAVLPDFEVARA